MSALIPRATMTELRETFLHVAEAHGLDAAIAAVARLGEEQGLGRRAKNHALSVLVERVATYCDIDLQLMLHGGNAQVYSRPRQIAMWCARQDGHSFPEIARALALTDHTTVMAGVRRVERTPELLERARRCAAVVCAQKALADGEAA